MGEILLYILLTFTCGAALFQPWIGVLAGYLFILLGPQHIWWWNFTDVRAFYIIAVATILGFGVAVFGNRIHFDTLRNRRTLFLLIWWFAIVLSYYFGPYVEAQSRWRFFDPDVVLSILNKTFLFYFVAVLCINNDRKYRYLIYIGLISVAYLTYWANMRYLDGYYGRLGGPRSFTGSIYSDQNVFAMFFVIMLPFLYYTGLACRNLLARYGLWLIIPFGWHAIFLTGSRGGLVGLAVTLFVLTLRSGHKGVALLLIPAFVIAYDWQAGSIMKERADTLAQYEAQDSVQTRFQAWAAARGMIAHHPVTGVGVASFGPAFPEFSDENPREAHNTILQISAENGVLAGLAWLALVLGSLLALWRRLAPPPPPNASFDDRLVYHTNDAILVSLAGYAACSTFLSLHVFEPFFYLLLLINYLAYRRQAASLTHPLSSRRPALGANT